MRHFALALLLTACGASENLLRAPPSEAFDVAFIPGCPTEETGRLSPCQRARAAHAALIWQKGWAQYFVTSGAATHSPFVEADAIAEAMTAMGVPAERIYLEPNARHTDENMYFSWLLARALRFSSIAVASNGSQAKWGCRMLVGWGVSCTAIGMHRKEVAAMLALHGKALDGIRPQRVADWVPMEVQEERVAAQTGYERPPSFLLYPLLGLLNLNRANWVPRPPDETPIVTWAERRSLLKSASE